MTDKGLSKPEARASNWGLPDGTQIPVIRLQIAGKSLAVKYEDVPLLIAGLATLHHQHLKGGEPNEGVSAAPL